MPPQAQFEAPSSHRRTRPDWRIAALVAASLGLQAPAAAQSGGPPGVIRDAEIEKLMRDYAEPVLRAAGVNTGATKIFLINDRAFNAFVADGRKIFVNLGAIMEAKTPNEMIGVLAHETGHIAGGHLSNLHQASSQAQVMAIIGMLAGAGAMVAASRANRPGSPVGIDNAGAAGLIMGPQEMAMRSLLSYVRGQEEAADRAAVKYLTATGQSARGLVTTMERFQNEALFKTNSVDPYLLSHPLPRERISNLETVAKASPTYGATDNPALQARHDLARAKLVGFMGNSGEVARRYPLSDTSLAGKYARAVAAYRFGRQADAIGQIDALIAAQPNNAYFHELKGQALLEAGRAREAIGPLRRATALAPAGLPIRTMLGHALLSAEQTDEAINILTKVTQSDREDGDAYQFLSMAYDRKGDTPQAQLAAAQSLFIAGRFVEARTQADRAKKQFKEGSPGWLKADDILNYRPGNGPPPKKE
jgi:predicted Zn-dependent protease